MPRDAKAVEEAAALVEQARAQIVQAEAQIKMAEAQREAAAAAARQAESDVDRLMAARVLAEKQFARVSGLVAERAADDQRLVDEQQSDLEAAVRPSGPAADRRPDGQGHASLAAAAEVDKAKADADRGQGDRWAWPRRSRDRLKVNLDYARIVAPFDGVVTHRTFHPGALIHSATEGGQQPLLTVKRTDMMRVVVLVPDRDVVLTKVGDPAVVSVDALDGRSFTGHPGADRPGRGRRADDARRDRPAQPRRRPLRRHVRQGHRSPSSTDAKSLAVPAACVVEHIGRSGGVVYVVRDGIARRTEVKLGGDNGSLAEILSGIGPDDPVDPALGHAARRRHARHRRPQTHELAHPTEIARAGRTTRRSIVSRSFADFVHVSGGMARPMNGLIRASLKNPIAVTVMVLALVVLGGLAAYSIPVDILPVFKSPAVQTLVFYSGMPAASIEKNITARLERGVGQASGGRRLESRSIVGISIVRDYFRSNVDRSGALTEVNSLRRLGISHDAAGHPAAGRPAV